MQDASYNNDIIYIDNWRKHLYSKCSLLSHIPLTLKTRLYSGVGTRAVETLKLTPQLGDYLMDHLKCSNLRANGAATERESQ